MLSSAALIWTRIGAGFFLCMALGLLYMIWHGRHRFVKERAWLAVSGEILVSSMKVPDNHKARYDRAVADCTTTIRYRYSVGGQVYESECLRSDRSAYMTPQDAQETVTKYPVGRRVEVFCDPGHPTDAVLEKRSGISPIPYVFFVLFTPIAAILTAHAITGRVLYTANGVPLFVLLLPAMLIAAGLASAAKLSALIAARKASRTWPTASGTITRSDMIKVRVATTRRGMHVYETNYQAVIRFSYRVGARDYSSDRYNWSWYEAWDDPARALAITAKYPPGAKVQVYCDPADPQNAVLDPTKGGVAMPLIFTVMFLGMGLLFLFLLLLLSASSVKWGH
ncbi:MAG: DUF3592 domain-containing protein [Novosphingobium sp.]|jgi:hypothetical protein|nr:DUF3592 domain-containing protein [Novosphingobium sp.]